MRERTKWNEMERSRMDVGEVISMQQQQIGTETEQMIIGTYKGLFFFLLFFFLFFLVPSPFYGIIINE